MTGEARQPMSPIQLGLLAYLPLLVLSFLLGSHVLSLHPCACIAALPASAGFGCTQQPAQALQSIAEDFFARGQSRKKYSTVETTRRIFQS